MTNPSKEHYEVVKWILRYLIGTTDVALCYDGLDRHVQGYVNFDLVDSRKSTKRYVFTLGSASTNWVFSLQKIVTISTVKAEYVAATEDCK